MTQTKRDHGLRCWTCQHYIQKDGFGLLVVDGGRVTVPLCRDCGRGALASLRVLKREFNQPRPPAIARPRAQPAQANRQ